MFGGIVAIVSVGQVVVATVVMLFYSWQLTLVVWVCFLPLFLSPALLPAQALRGLRCGPPRRSASCSPRSPSPSWAPPSVRTYAIEDRTQDRIDEAIARYQQASTRAQGLTAFSFSLGGVSAGLANAGVLVVGICSGSPARSPPARCSRSRSW